MNTLTFAGEESYFQRTGNELEDARRLLVRMWQSRGSKTSDRSGWRHDKQGRSSSSCPKEWKRVLERIKQTADRLQDAQLENRPALDVIKQYHFPEVLIYADPPYPLSTRSKRMYANEMTDEDHVQLLEVLDSHPGPVLLSGYSCDLYDARLKHWTRKTAKGFAEGGREREEVLWLNPVANLAIGTRLF
jgi:DNA adenine methylase